jgi:hypothetical protein
LSFVAVLYAAWALAFAHAQGAWPALALLVLAWVITWPGMALAAAVRPLAGCVVLVQNLAVTLAIMVLALVGP